MVEQKNKNIYFLIIISIVFAQPSDGAKILFIFPMAAHSHQRPALTLSHALSDRGHNLTVITANPSKVPKENHRDIDISELYSLFRSDELEKKTGFILQKRSNGIERLQSYPSMVNYVHTKMYNCINIKKLIKEVNGTKYDLIISENFWGDSFLGFADLVGNPPIIGISTFVLPSFGSVLGNPIIPSYIPSMFHGVSDHMTFIERLKNCYITIYSYYIFHWCVRRIQEKFMHDNFGNLYRNINELRDNISLMIVLTDLATQYARPFQPNTINVGPIHLAKNKDSLPEDIKKWMDDSEDGVIYFSLGNLMQGTSVPPQKRTIFIEAFKKFPKIRVLWKWEADTNLPGQPNNVLLKKWIPQEAVLAHPKLRLFISQVGLQSFQEAIYYEVPILAVPLFGDQDQNARKIVVAGMGLMADYESITADVLYEKINELLTNESYKKNMIHQSMITRDTPMSPLDTAVWWVEYVLRHNGATHLRPAVLDLTLIQYFMLDILFILVIFISIIVYVTYFMVKKLTKYLFIHQRL